ncbi:MAG: energy transducer TonB [Winogradskyella sp.]|nr:MAG: energy transducer TonB [Winogradskyella sp.]
MKKQSQNNNTAGQSGIEVRKSQKHEVNLQKNSTLYFQIGLILCLLGTFALFEMQFESKAIVVQQQSPDDETIDIAMTDIKVYEPEVKQEPKKVASTKLIDTYIPKEDDFVDPEPKDLITPDNNVTDKKPVDVGSIVDPIEPPVEIDVPFVAVEFVPVYPGCEKYKSNAKKKKCMSDKITKLVKKKFNTEIASEYGLYGVQKIYAHFKIDKNGRVVEINSRAPHPKLEAEAARVLNIIPKMKPGMQQDKPVNVMYSLPITFRVEN